jgi:hypothetical protein
MKRREFITLLGGAAAAWPLAARVQQPKRMRRLAIIMLTADDADGQARITALRERLEKLGWLCEKDAEPLGHNIIHSVTNPISRLTGAIHVYGGDFFAAERSEWDPETLREQPYDVEKTLRLFEEANRQ